MCMGVGSRVVFLSMIKVRCSLWVSSKVNVCSSVGELFSRVMSVVCGMCSNVVLLLVWVLCVCGW